ncbi:aldehyde-activating protein [Dankookia rubra]|uniref:Aldehyde-activating protein n=1 Tax=Dankookia rubra TaxID=1442381 RepID=A0A4R5QK12_9PROT|nr:GFA family protein [Dankookia rubra]TDH63159.1 aldehyde-activating protein [Dankookia rubra]
MADEGGPITLPQTGGCLCGAVRYEITRPPLAAYTCHCTACQRLTGSAFSAAFVIAAEACRFTGGEVQALQRPADSGRVVTRWVCRGCGTWICNGARPGTAAAGSLVVVRAGTLDDTAWLRPTAHFWTRSAQPWVILPEGDARFETQPEDGLAWLRSVAGHPPQGQGPSPG